MEMAQVLETSTDFLLFGIEEKSMIDFSYELTLNCFNEQSFVMVY